MFALRKHPARANTGDCTTQCGSNVVGRSQHVQMKPDVGKFGGEIGETVAEEAKACGSTKGTPVRVRVEDENTM